MKHKLVFLLAVSMFGGLAVGANAQQRKPIVVDWTHQHVIYPESENAEEMGRIRQDPRYEHEWYRRHPEAWWPIVVRPRWKKDGSHRDWSVSLGPGPNTTVRQTYAAKYVYNVTATPSCANDYVVSEIPVTNGGSTTQASLIAFYNLYTGTIGAQTGLCGNATAPSVLFAYNIRTGANVRSSVTPSLDGKKIALVDYPSTALGGNSQFHVLTWTKGNGTSATAPATPTAAQLYSYTLGAASTTNVFVDFQHDAAYCTAGNVMYKFSPVFNATPALAWTLTFPGVTGNGQLSSPVVDQVTRHVFVEDTNGTVWYADDSGTTPSVGSNSWNFATADAGHPPIVDSTNQKVYVYSANGTVGSIVGQADTTLSAASRVTVSIGAASTAILPESPDFSNAYYNGTLTGAALYQVGINPGSTHSALYSIGFSTGFKLNTTTAAGPIDLATGAVENSPITEFYNSTLGKDFLFISTYDNCQASGVTGGCVRAIDITSGFPTSVNPGTGSNAIIAASGGSSGITVDNNSSAVEASSIYYFTFSTTGSTCGTGNYCLVKATQSGLN